MTRAQKPGARLRKEKQELGRKNADRRAQESEKDSIRTEQRQGWERTLFHEAR